MGGGVIEEVAGRAGVEAEVDAGSSDGMKFGGAIFLVEEHIGTAAPDAEAAGRGFLAMPQLMRGDVRPMNMREEVVQARGMEDGKAPKGWRGLSMDHEAASNGAEELVASFSNAILLWRRRKRVGGGDTARGVERSQLLVEEFAATAIHSGAAIAVNMLDGTPQLEGSFGDPLHQSSRSIGLGFEEDSSAKPSGMIDDGEKEEMTIAIAGFGWLAEVHMDSVKGLTSGVGLRRMREGNLLGLSASGAGWAG